MQENLKAVSRIGLLRENARLTQLELSRLIGVTETTIQNWEKGRAGLEQIERVIKLCKALDCNLDDLIEYVADNEVVETSATPESKAKGRLSKLRQKLGTEKPAQTTQIESQGELNKPTETPQFRTGT